MEEGGECMRPGPENCRVSKLVKARKLLVEDEEVIVVQAQMRGSVHGLAPPCCEARRKMQNACAASWQQH